MKIGNLVKIKPARKKLFIITGLCNDSIVRHPKQYEYVMVAPVDNLFSPVAIKRTCVEVISE